ncbi:hypothetical protein SAMN05216267_1003242 [Actinacidiphila rubida]|uniref:Uncharacterized protein n=1 Tax=Actinacidiphila rubida TaxID=310780 RepID=A0A1H8FC62_9ACTN|nr:hypothetical protein [Actinacidiphila rubida]SEN29299.1 hypothetical protein SAMN05216267_1003242 [Actinacidiphila rubida]
MPDWPGRSLRDRAIRAYAEPLLVRTPGPVGRLPAVLLLGPRGSGKTTLLRRLEAWGRAAPLAHLDLAAMERDGKTLFDALADLAFQLQARKDDVPPLGFPSFTVLLLAAAAAVSSRDRPAAIAEMQTLLQGPDRQELSLETVQPLLDGAAAVSGGLLPGWVTQIVPVIRSTQRLQAKVRLRRRIAQASHDVGGPRAGADFLVSVNQLFHGYPEQQREAQRLLLEGFLADLRAAYETRAGHGRRTTHCLVLLDNADGELGEELMQLLLDARGGVPGRPGRTDPLLVLATARRTPETLVREERRLAAPPRYSDGWSAEGERFAPVPAGRLHVGRLRDLNRAEVEDHAKEVLSALPDGAVRPDAERSANASYWLGWVVYTATRGQPAATGAVLDALSRFPAGTPWDQRVQGWPALPSAAAGGGAEARERRHPTVADTVLDWLLADCPAGLRAVLPRAAAAVTQGQAEAATQLWRGVPPALVRQFEDDGRLVYHPVVRFLLLRQLEAVTGDGPGTWNGAHTALADAAGDDERTVAYHDLAADRLDAAVDHLHARFHLMPAERWCDDLALIQRAPARRLGGRPETARIRYMRLVGTPWGDEERQAITRLLVAGWITAHPRSAPYADGYEDPLGDPYAELYAYIADEFRTLRRLTRAETDRDVFKARAEQYERKPW